MNIEEKLNEIRSKHLIAMRQETQQVETEYYQEKFPDLNVHKVSHSRQGTQVNEVGLKYSFDQYLNGRYEWSCVPPVELLPVFADLIRRQEEQSHPEHSYKFRVLQGMFIDLAGKHYQQYNAEQMLRILQLADSLPVERNNRQRSGFRAWLLTRSYVCDDRGALGTYFREWPHKTNFLKLLV